ncbi:MAG TPA: adenylate/guanylate cyclase domain-containing protein [Acidimicrobiales bacterium]|nr:adenylate/guanylate cyclase domain-containing protein [Acidimicrobiales bacterium]
MVQNIEMTIPSGTITLLFSDIEGSTKLWERASSAMNEALRRHDAIVRGAIDAESGYVFKTFGDAFCAVFTTSDAAARATDTLQRALRGESWPTGAEIRVRVALHTGVCQERDGDYFGPTVNRAARLLAIGHGGQSVVSGATAELLSDLLGEWGTLEDLGQHRLKDLGRPEHVWQLTPKGVIDEFPPLRSLDNPDLPNNLPALLSSFIGREHELNDVRDLVQVSRLVTLTGAGGSGKTRLAMQSAAELLDGTGEGVWLIELAPVADAEQVPLAVASVLGILDGIEISPLDTLLRALATQAVLIILDNCEHVIDACAKFADAVLRNCPKVHLLVTSREPLGVDGERVYRVPSMTLPGADVETIADLGESDAVTLFFARAADSGFVFTDEGAPLVASICKRLDGIPLALELAAARLSSMSLVQLSDRLDQRFRLLTGGSRNAMARQQTLQAMVDWSYGLLNPMEQSVLRRLSVFSGGFELEAAEAVVSSETVDEFDVANLLHSLVEKSLVVADHDSVSLRFRLLETIRQYAAQELLKIGGESEVFEARDRHATYFEGMATVAGREFIGPLQARWLKQLDLEMDNYRAMLTHLASDPARARETMRVVTSLERYFQSRGHIEVIPFLLSALNGVGEARDVEVASAWVAASILIGWLFSADRSEIAISSDCAARGLEMARELGERDIEARALGFHAMIANYNQDFVAAVVYIEEALELVSTSDNARLKVEILAWSVNNRIARQRGMTLEQRMDIELEMIVVATKLQDAMLIATRQSALARSYVTQERFAEALTLWAAAVASLEELGAHELLHSPRDNLLLARCHLRAFDEALPLMRSCLRAERRTGFRREIGDLIFAAACIASARGDGVRAATLHGAADALREEAYKTGQLYKDVAEVVLEEESFALVRALLGDEIFERDYASGSGLSNAEACDLALQL